MIYSFQVWTIRILNSIGLGRLPWQRDWLFALEHSTISSWIPQINLVTKWKIQGVVQGNIVFWKHIWIMCWRTSWVWWINELMKNLRSITSFLLYLLFIYFISILFYIFFLILRSFFTRWTPIDYIGTKFNSTACATYGGQRESDFSLRRHFSMIMSSTHIPSQGLGWPEELVFRLIPKCAERRDWNPIHTYLTFTNAN